MGGVGTRQGNRLLRWMWMRRIIFAHNAMERSVLIAGSLSRGIFNGKGNLGIVIKKGGRRARLRLQNDNLQF